MKILDGTKPRNVKTFFASRWAVAGSTMRQTHSSAMSLSWFCSVAIENMFCLERNVKTKTILLPEIQLLKDFENFDFWKKFWNFSKIFIFFRNYRKKQIFKFNYNYQFLKYSIHSSCWNLIQCSKNPFVAKDCECAHVRARFWCLKIVKNGKIMFFE